MAKSAEYPDLRWIPPKAFGKGRDGKAVAYIVIHYTAGSERSTSAEDGAAYDQRREDGTSTHYFVDQDSIVQCVRTTDRGNAARHRGNRLGIQYELCGTAQTTAQWLDAASKATLRLAARQVARDCKKYNIPVRRLSVAETRRAWTEFPNGPKGIVGHVDCTHAYPEDGGDHTDPGTGFPWSTFISYVNEYMEDDMATDPIKFFTTALANTEVRKLLVQAVFKTDGVLAAPVPGKNSDGTPNEFWAAGSILHQTYNQAAKTNTGIAALSGRDVVDEDAIVAGFLAGLPVDRIVALFTAALPAEMARQVVEELGVALARQSE